MLRMKRKNMLKKFMVVVVFAAILCTGCGKNPGTNIDDKPGVTGTTTPEATPTEIPTPTTTPEATPTPTEIPKNTNPLNFEGITEYEKDKVLDAAEHVKLLTKLNDGTLMDGQYVADFSIVSYEKDYVLVKFVAAPSPNDYFMGENCKTYFYLLDAKTLEIVKEVVLDAIYTMQQTGEVIVLESYANPGWRIKSYNFELNEVADIQVPNDYAGICTKDGKRRYYIMDQKLYVLNGENGVNMEVYAGSITADYLEGVVTDVSGTDFVVFRGTAQDFIEYRLVLDVSTGEFVRGSEVEKNKYCEIDKNTYEEGSNSGLYINQWLIGVSKDKAFDYKWNGEDINIKHNILNNQNQFFSYSLGNNLYCYLYDYKTGALVGSTTFDVESMVNERYFEVFGKEKPYGAQVYCYDTPVYLDENTLLLQLSNTSNEIFFVAWDLNKDSANADQMVVTPHKMGSGSSVDVSKLLNHVYTPGKLSASLKPLRQKADALETKYGIEIYIGEECATTIGGYKITPLLKYAKIEDALGMLDKELARYPENFFKQLSYSWIKGLDICLTGDISGVGENTVADVGGLKALNNYRVVLVLNCTENSIETTLHHEMCHAIEEKIVHESYLLDKPLFNENAWNKLNPYADMYTYSYEEYGYDKYSEYTYEKAEYTNQFDIAYFVDEYSMTYPTEDRARIFEAVMTDKKPNLDFKKAPHLVKKLNYYAECIREVFDTTGWKNVPWEKYM